MKKTGNYIMRLFNEENERFNAFLKAGNFTSIATLKRNIALREVRQPNREELELDINGHILEFDLSNN